MQVRGNQLPFRRCLNIRAALQQRGRQAGGHGGRRQLLRQPNSPFNLARIPPQRCLSRFSCCAIRLFKVGDPRGGLLHQNLRLMHIHQRDRAPFSSVRFKARTLAARIVSAARSPVPDPVRAGRNTRCYVGDQRRYHRLLSPLALPSNSARAASVAFRYVPRNRAAKPRRASVRRCRFKPGKTLNPAPASRRSRSRRWRELVRPRDARLCLRLRHASGRDLHTGAAVECRADQLLQGHPTASTIRCRPAIPASVAALPGTGPASRSRAVDISAPSCNPHWHAHAPASRSTPRRRRIAPLMPGLLPRARWPPSSSLKNAPSAVRRTQSTPGSERSQ